MIRSRQLPGTGSRLSHAPDQGQPRLVSIGIELTGRPGIWQENPREDPDRAIRAGHKPARSAASLRVLAPCQIPALARERHRTRLRPPADAGKAGRCAHAIADLATLSDR